MKKVGFDCHHCHHPPLLMGNAAAQQHCAALVRSLSKQALDNICKPLYNVVKF